MARTPKALATTPRPRFLVKNRETEEIEYAVSYRGESPRGAQRVRRGLSLSIDTKRFRIKDDP